MKKRYRRVKADKAASMEASDGSTRKSLPQQTKDMEEDSQAKVEHRKKAK